MKTLNLKQNGKNSTGKSSNIPDTGVIKGEALLWAQDRQPLVAGDAAEDLRDRPKEKDSKL